MEKMGWLRNYPWSSEHGLMVTGLYWGWLVNRGRQHGLRLGSEYIEVRFEDLVSRPRETLATLGDFIEHPLDYDRIRRMGMGPVGRPNTSFQDEIDGFGFNPIGRWKRAMSADQLALFESWVGRFLEKMGYPIATPPERLKCTLDIGRRRVLYPWIFDLKTWLTANTPARRICGKFHGLPIECEDFSKGARG